MNRQKIEACFVGARTLVFDDLRNRNRAPQVMALVFDAFDAQTYKVATYLKAVAGIHDMVLVLDTYTEGLVHFSLVDKVQQTTYNSTFYPCSHERYEAFVQKRNEQDKIIFTFYHESEGSLLMLEDDTPFFLYLPYCVQVHRSRIWKTG